MQLPIVTQRLYITEFDESMAESTYINSLDEDNRRFIPDEVFETVDKARATISTLISYYSLYDAPLVYPIMLRDGRHIGHVQAIPIEDKWEVGYHVAKQFTGCGYATEAVSAFLPPIMHRLSLSQIFGTCHAENIASRRVLEKCGFALDFEGIGLIHGVMRPICRYMHYNEFRLLERMDDFYDARADIYDKHMLCDLGLDGFYEAISACFDKPVNRLLDLGCGTGLELARLFERFPNMEVVGIDMSSEMMRKLEEKYRGKRIELKCGSFFNEDFGGVYDAILSTYSLHHFDEERKLELYKKVYAALEPGGIYVFGDYTIATMERQQELLAANAEKRREQGVPDNELWHYDTPFTAETEIRLMMAAGFATTEIIKQWDNASIIIAGKCSDKNEAL